MQFEVCSRLAALDFIGSSPRAGVMRAILSIPFAVHRFLVSLVLTGRVRRAGVMCAARVRWEDLTSTVSSTACRSQYVAGWLLAIPTERVHLQESCAQCLRQRPTMPSSASFLEYPPALPLSPAHPSSVRLQPRGPVQHAPRSMPRSCYRRH